MTPLRCCVALSALLLFGSLLTGSAQSEPAPSLAEAVTPAGVRFHMAAFQRIADANGGTRAAGTPGYAASLRYAEGVLRRAGYRVMRQTFDIQTGRILAETGRTVGAEPLNLEPAMLAYSPNTPVGGLMAALSVPTDALGCSPTDFPAVQGTIVLIERGVCTFGQKAQNAAAAGARAALIYNTDDTRLSATLGDAPGTVPTAGVTRTVGERLRAALEGGETHVRLELRASNDRRPTANLIAEWEGTDGDTTVMLGAHLDSVRDGPGINDNGSGSALILELALKLAQTGEAVGARFAFWGAEELGLLGSRHYVATLEPDDLRELRAYLNFDMVASPNAALFAYGDSPLTALFQRSLREHDLSAITTDLGGASDHAPFAQVGVPVAGLFSGAWGDKSLGQAGDYGGVAHEPYDSCYHQACDTLRSVTTPSATLSLDRIADAAADALQTLLTETETNTP